MVTRIRVGNGCGFWGDNRDAPVELVARGQLDYLTLEYLAELTMSILAQQRQRDPHAGFAHDILELLERLQPHLEAQPNLKIITNAGGMNPLGCAAAARALVPSDRAIGVVSGDDLMPCLDELIAAGHSLAHLDSGRPLADVRERIVCANAYFGAEPIAAALKQGASVVITGRVADASLTVGPAMYELGWSWDDFDRLSAATVAGHLIECGAQVTGGLWFHWDETDLSHVGYPIAEIVDDGSFTITKPDGTGGRVNEETVAEQLLYEVGDPAAYMTPDVVSDFTSVTLDDRGGDVVHVSGARGRPATNSYKVSIAYRDGFTAAGTLVIAGPAAASKARRCGAIILDRLARAGVVCDASHIEVLGAGDSLPGVLPTCEPPEVVLRVAVRDSHRSAVERFSKEFSPLVTSGPPGITGYTTGRPTVREVLAYWPALLDKRAISPRVEVRS